MKQIILASKSKARAQLLKKCGFKFSVKASGARERKYIKPHSVKHLVIYNATLKARSVGNQVRSGIVIAADTVVLQNKNIFGKPKSKKDAFVMIRQLSKETSYVYTGVVVYNVKDDLIYADYEKTKVWLMKLTDREINKYLSGADKMHLNFAGGFDIQGKGSLFIERIEGCFYNVVGLPMVKLRQLLKKCKIVI